MTAPDGKRNPHDTRGGYDCGHQNCQQRQLKKSRAVTTMTDLAGYLASTMVLLTFLTKDMRLLRVLGILSNVAFITYAVLDSLPPVLVLHLLLLPINVFRLRSLLAEEGLPVDGPCWSAITKFFGAHPHRLPPLAPAEELRPRHRRRAGQAVGATQASPAVFSAASNHLFAHRT